VPPPLEGRVSLVTGAGRGIGRATAIALHQAGSAVVLGARTESQLDEVAEQVKDEGGQALAAYLDVTDLDSVRNWVGAAMDRFGRIDVLVNNAGSNNGGEEGAVGPLWEINPEAWWTDVAINFRGTFLCSHAVLPHMIAQGRGHIVNVTSLVAGIPWPYDSAYACSKAAQIRLTDSLAAELRGQGVYVFALSPGRVRSELVDGAVNTRAGRKWLAPSVAEQPFSAIPPEAPASAVVFLVSGEADQLTGRVVHTGWDLASLARQAADIAERDVLQIRFAPADSQTTGATAPSQA
jgi:NAD(P)-dependent dehydrogenase (short-subunit alcohol dehydrogenase family)